MRLGTKRRFTAQAEPLEGRNAPSGGLSSALHHLADARHEHAMHHHAQIGQVRAQHAPDDNLPRHSGQDEQTGHNAADDNLPRHGGQDDGANHNAGDDQNRNRGGRG